MKLVESNQRNSNKFIDDDINSFVFEEKDVENSKKNNNLNK